MIQGAVRHPFTSPQRPLSQSTQPPDCIQRRRQLCRCSSADEAGPSSRQPSPSRRALLLSAGAAAIWYGPKPAAAEPATDTAPLIAPAQKRPQKDSKTYNEKDFVLEVPLSFREVKQGPAASGFAAGGRRLSTRELIAAATPLRAKFTSEDGAEQLTVIQRNASEIKQTFFQITDVSQFGSIQEAAQLLLPPDVQVIASGSLVLEQEARDTGTVLGKVEVPPQTIYRYTFQYQDERAHLAIVAKAGKVYLVAGATSAERWPEASARLKAAVRCFGPSIFYGIARKHAGGAFVLLRAAQSAAQAADNQPAEPALGQPFDLGTARHDAGQPVSARQAGQAVAPPDTVPLPTVAIVGRPNVGKSALFNRLVGRRDALVYNTPGGHVTRDYKEGQARLGDLHFRCIDTSGLEPFMAPTSVQGRATALTTRVLQKADLALLLLDARAGIGSEDSQLAAWLRKAVSTPVTLAANKCERRSPAGEAGVGDALAEATRLGLGVPVAISAETGEGMADLYIELQPKLEEITASMKAADEEGARDAAQLSKAGMEKSISLTVMGLPNVGKSTLSNRLLGEERSLTGPEPGLTRDVVRATFTHGPYSIHLMDTAGRMRAARLANFDDAQGAVAARTLAQGSRSMQMSQTVLLLLDSHEVLHSGGPTRAEISLASTIADEGRSLVVVANKTDTLSPSQRNQVVDVLRYKFDEQLPELAGVPVISISALNGAGTAMVMPTVMRAYDIWTQRITTSRLNRWLAKMAAGFAGKGGTSNELAKIRYITQVKARPPTFAAFTRSDELSENTRKQLINSIRREFDFAGVPIRMLVRSSKQRKAGK